MDKESGEFDQLEYEIYIEERKSLTQANKDTAQQFDKFILTLSAGAFAISITFLEKIAPDPSKDTLIFLVLSWSSFIISMLSTLFSFISSQLACEKQIKILENNLMEKKSSDKNKWASYTKYLNYSSIAFFIIGACLLAFFSFNNLNSKRDKVMEKSKEVLTGLSLDDTAGNKKKKEIGTGGYVPPSTPKTKTTKNDKDEKNNEK